MSLIRVTPGKTWVEHRAAGVHPEASLRPGSHHIARDHALRLVGENMGKAKTSIDKLLILLGSTAEALLSRPCRQAWNR